MPATSTSNKLHSSLLAKLLKCTEHVISIKVNFSSNLYCLWGLDSGWLVNLAANLYRELWGSSIHLCNVLYKIITKILANKLKVVLPHIISPTQIAFVPSRLITDNVLIAYELMYFLRNKWTCKEVLMSLKLDINKTYDRVEWTFL